MAAAVTIAAERVVHISTIGTITTDLSRFRRTTWPARKKSPQLLLAFVLS
jgi:hypothetical protein